MLQIILIVTKTSVLYNILANVQVWTAQIFPKLLNTFRKLELEF